MRIMNVLIGCECSGITRQAFRTKGHNAWSCDLMPADDRSLAHFQDNILNVLKYHHHPILGKMPRWDLAIFMPPCTYLANAQVHLLDREEEIVGRGWIPRRQLRDEALWFVQQLMDADIPRIALENPRGYINSEIRTHDQVVRPWEHGEGIQKEICLWLKNLPKLQPTNIVEGRRSSWWATGNTGKARQKQKSMSYQGVAAAMADQWGRL